MIIVMAKEGSLKKGMFSIRRCPNYPPDDDRNGEDDYSDMTAATIPPSVWQSANLQICASILSIGWGIRTRGH